MGTVNELLKIANGELGTKEAPSGSNKVKYAEWYGLNGYAWCVMFVQWCFAQANVSLPVKTASCTVLMNYAKKADMWVTSGYQPGDVVIYDWGGDKVPDHCGIVESVDGSYITAIEGNTAVGNDSDGGEVMRRNRTVNQIIGAVRPQFMEDDMDLTKWTDDQITYLINRIQNVLAKKEASETLESELKEAVEMGITDGSDPNALCSRIQASVMCKRTAKYIESK